MTTPKGKQWATVVIDYHGGHNFCGIHLSMTIAGYVTVVYTRFASICAIFYLCTITVDPTTVLASTPKAKDSVLTRSKAMDDGGK